MPEQTEIRKKLLEELQSRSVVVTEIFSDYISKTFGYPKDAIDSTIEGFIKKGIIRKSPKFVMDGKEFTRLTCK